MIRQGKPYKFHYHPLDENKENTDQNAFKPHFLQKLKHPKLDKKLSSSTNYSSQNTTILNEEAIKQAYSQQIAQFYSSDILGHIVANQVNLENFLVSHSITPSLRSKMVDWMIEVLSSYKMSEESFFKSVQMMDLYLKSETEGQQTKDIHLIGITCMFSAMKYEQIHPMRLGLMREKIGRKKFTKEEILEKQSRIMQTINFKLQQTNLYEIVKHIKHQLPLNLQPSYDSYFSKILLYLSKMCMFQHQLVSKDLRVLAAAVYFIALKTLQQVNKSFCPEDALPPLSQLLTIMEDGIIETGREVLELAKGFSRLYPSLNNLRRFNKFEYKEE